MPTVTVATERQMTSLFGRTRFTVDKASFDIGRIAQKRVPVPDESYESHTTGSGYCRTILRLQEARR